MFDWREDRWPLTFDLPRANASYSCDPASSQRKCFPLRSRQSPCPSPEQRFAATKPAYEAMIAAGFLRKCIPFSAGGRERWSDRYRDHGRGTLRGERQRYVNVDWNRPWTIAALDRRHGGAAESAAASILETSRGAAGGVLRHRTRRQRQCSIASARRGRAHHGEVLGRQMDHPRSKKLGFLGHGLGSQGRGRSVGTLPHRSRCSSRAGYFGHTRGASCIRPGLRAGDRFGGASCAPLAAVRTPRG